MLLSRFNEALLLQLMRGGMQLQLSLLLRACVCGGVRIVLPSAAKD